MLERKSSMRDVEARRATRPRGPDFVGDGVLRAAPLALDCPAVVVEDVLRATRFALDRPAPPKTQRESCTVLLDLEHGPRLTLHIEARGARVRVGDTRDREDGLPSCRVRLTASAWRDICQGRRPVLGADVEVLGDPRALVALGMILQQRVSPIQTRISPARASRSSIPMRYST